MSDDTTTTVQDITSEDSFNSQISALPSTALAVLYFHAPWAAPCKQMSTILSTLASTYPSVSPPNIVFLALNAEDLPELSERYDVTAVPYIVLEKGGQVVETVSGSDASKVRVAVEKHAGVGKNGAKSDLPPEQSISKRPLAGPEPGIPQPDDTQNTNGGVKNLSAYAPGSPDPKTAPEYSGAGGESSKEELFARLSELVKAAPVMLFMKGTPSAPQCGFSRQTVNLLREKSVRYGFFNILADDEVRQGLKEFADWPTFPQLWVGGELVGGLDIVKEEFENDPDFLKDYSVSAKRNDGGGPAAPEAQTQTA
ncbi:monothiol glutaredoxin-like protein-4 [Patellaria atrata CBS 101060]|uniref:Monothiol glutaredoxin-like protein-4 n=1 Tax=Patellaria atrata CBS 101060 TaxID=1346257 RepID=A0A9P4S732_9PEZI|nr:monothiol glutaredoxin-like protein-4 [Patellaria atrata CBS 101060]